MSNDALFSTQLASILIFIIALFVLYRMLVKNKDATIETLQAQIADARQPISDVLFRALKDRTDSSLAEVERLSKDKETLQGANKRVQGYVDALIMAIDTQRELIRIQKKFCDWVIREYTADINEDQPVVVIPIP